MRFPGFTEAWETKKLADINIINPKNENLPFSFIYIDLESVVNGCLLKEERILKDEAPSRAQRRLTKGDILFQMVRPYQKNNLYFDKEGDYVASTGYAQIRTLQNSQFVFQYLHNQKFVDKVIERCTGTSYPAINSSDLGNIKIHYPNSREQNKIANFLELLDNRIQTQNKILLNHKSLIKNLRDMLFKHKIRFKDDNGNEFPDWVSCKLKDIAHRIVQKNSEKNTNVLTISAQYGLISQLEFFNKSVSAKDLSGYYLLDKGDFAYNKSYSNGYPMGAIKRLIKYDKGIVSTLYICFRFNEDVNKDYMEHYFESQIQNIEIEKIAQEGARNHGLLNVGISDFFDIKVNLPSIIEQEKIGAFLAAINRKIQIENEILERLESQKQYLLNQIFV